MLPLFKTAFRNNALIEIHDLLSFRIIHPPWFFQKTLFLHRLALAKSCFVFFSANTLALNIKLESGIFTWINTDSAAIAC
jgi:hypothetical protein